MMNDVQRSDARDQAYLAVSPLGQAMVNVARGLTYGGNDSVVGPVFQAAMRDALALVRDAQDFLLRAQLYAEQEEKRRAEKTKDSDDE